jgi:hypothetical protein
MMLINLTKIVSQFYAVIGDTPAFVVVPLFVVSIFPPTIDKHLQDRSLGE